MIVALGGIVRKRRAMLTRRIWRKESYSEVTVLEVVDVCFSGRVVIALVN